MCVQLWMCHETLGCAACPWLSWKLSAIHVGLLTVLDLFDIRFYEYEAAQEIFCLKVCADCNTPSSPKVPISVGNLDIIRFVMDVLVSKFLKSVHM